MGGTDENMGYWVTGCIWGGVTITYINIYLVDTTKNCKEKRLKIRDIISKWINVKKYLAYGGINRIFKLGLKIMIKLGNKGCIRYPGGTGILGING